MEYRIEYKVDHIVLDLLVVSRPSHALLEAASRVACRDTSDTCVAEVDAIFDCFLQLRVVPSDFPISEEKKKQREERLKVREARREAREKAGDRWKKPETLKD